MDSGAPAMPVPARATPSSSRRCDATELTASSGKARRREHGRHASRERETVRIVVPTRLPHDLATFLDIVASQVAVGGLPLEDELRAREADNSYFAFLTAPWNDPAATYYRWRLYSLLQGDTLTRWRTEPFALDTHQRWVVVPPPLPPRLSLGDGGIDDQCGASGAGAGAGGLHATTGPGASGVGLLATPCAVAETFPEFPHQAGKGSGDVHKVFGRSILPAPFPTAVPLIRAKACERLLSLIATRPALANASGRVQAFFDALSASEEDRWRRLIAPACLQPARRGAVLQSPPATSSASQSPTPEEGPGGTSSEPPKAAGVSFYQQLVSEAEGLLARKVIRKRSIFVAQRVEHAHHLLALLVDAAEELSLLQLPPPLLRRGPGSTSDGAHHAAAEVAGLWLRAMATDALALLFTVHDVVMNAKKARAPSTAIPAPSSSTGVPQTASNPSGSSGSGEDMVSFYECVHSAAELTLRPFLDALVRLAVRMVQRAALAGHCKPIPGQQQQQQRPTDGYSQLRLDLRPIVNASSSSNGAGDDEDPAGYDASVGPARVILAWLRSVFLQWRSEGALSVRLLSDLCLRFGSLLSPQLEVLDVGENE